MQYVNSLLELVGNTPLLKLRTTTGDAKPLVLAKVEYLNPGGSVKDRIAMRMVQAAEPRGGLGEGPDRAAQGRGGRGVWRAAARRHHRRADLRQHRGGTGDRGPGEGLS